MAEVVTRGHLPHWYKPGAAHFVTFRLAGSLPMDTIRQLQQRKEHLLRQRRPSGTTESAYRERVHKQLFVSYDRVLDEGSSVSWLKDGRLAALVRGSLYFLHGKKYDLLAFTIMPNHVHVLFLPYDLREVSADDAFSDGQIGETPDRNSPLSGIMHSLKSYTAHEANKLLRREGSFWQHESYDHWVRDEVELQRIVDYINANAVKASLAPRSQAWYWCSAHDRYLTDGDSSGWLVGQASRLS